MISIESTGYSLALTPISAFTVTTASSDALTLKNTFIVNGFSILAFLTFWSFSVGTLNGVISSISLLPLFLISSISRSASTRAFCLFSSFSSLSFSLSASLLVLISSFFCAASISCCFIALLVVISSLAFLYGSFGTKAFFFCPLRADFTPCWKPTL